MQTGVVYDMKEIVVVRRLGLGVSWQVEERAEIDGKEVLHICITKLEGKWNEDNC